MNLFNILLIVGLLVMGAIVLLTFISAVNQAPNGHPDNAGFHLDSADPTAQFIARGPIIWLSAPASQRQATASHPHATFCTWA